MMAFLMAAYDEEEVTARAAPSCASTPPRAVQGRRAAAPKKDDADAVAREVFELLAAALQCDYDETQAIGRRYRRQDEIGTPFCVTVDFDSLDDRAVTVRERDSMEQVRVPIDDVSPRFARSSASELTSTPPCAGSGSCRRRVGDGDHRACAPRTVRPELGHRAR